METAATAAAAVAVAVAEVAAAAEMAGVRSTRSHGVARSTKKAERTVGAAEAAWQLTTGPVDAPKLK